MSLSWDTTLKLAEVSLAKHSVMDGLIARREQ